ncbi:dihydrolipoamide acetyltransferase family protein [Peribacillus sp. TH27]|uniref:dihydrolipoamide acetyltransferase family protein n=1 Tax=Peribacillus sp. TH27 TaxID=2798484 RepID=UPI00191360C6|nr:dihydrolipoamide acetyltransferase family protein [Peribacillus sp. TH27]MBK5463518.1 2-oxo acid dehydrogenase subunit E2 [Peribacillus sp. TH27]
MVEVKLHDIGEGIHEGDILTYFVKVGDRVTVDQPLVEVHTEKMVAELTSPASGIVKELMIEPGTTIEIGTTVLTIEAEGSSALQTNETEVKAEKLTPKNAETKMEAPQRGKNKGRGLAAPYTRKIARDHGVDINLIEGTGPAGRVTEKDVIRFARNREENAAGVEITSTPATTTASQTTEVETVEPDVIPFKGIRKQIAKKMSQSLYTIPHVTHFEEIDMTNLLDYRKELKAIDVNISVVAFFIKALAVSLKDFPIFNAKLDEENEVIRLEKVVHMGLATDSEQGLIVPVLRDAHKKSLRQIHADMKELTKKTQEGKLSGKEMSGSTFTISNVGPMGSIGATPIINYPETGLIAFHKTKKMPVVNENDEIVIRSIMNISMSFDHRVADGGTAVAFTNRFKKLIEAPNLLFLELN